MGPKELRELARSGKNFTTSGLAKGHVQTNVVIIPKSYAFEFTLFCIRNPKPCPIIEDVQVQYLLFLLYPLFLNSIITWDFLLLPEDLWMKIKFV